MLPLEPNSSALIGKVSASPRHSLPELGRLSLSLNVGQRGDAWRGKGGAVGRAAASFKSPTYSVADRRGM